MPHRPHHAFPYVLVSPNYLAGGGNWEHLTKLLVRGYGWQDVSTLDHHSALTSPDGRLHVVLHRQTPGNWTLRGSTPHARQWAAVLDEHLPVEYVTATVEALLRPTAPKEPGVLDRLHAAGWTTQATTRAPSALSPDGLVRITHHRGDSSEESRWHAECTVKGRRWWTATFSAHTPTAVVGAFAAQLASPDPLPRMAIGTPLYGCEHHTRLLPCTLGREDESAQLAARIAHARTHLRPGTGTAPPVKPTSNSSAARAR
ncbi:DUF317 domain-containing protein [Streptomyces sp. 769]|uniref:DUF317 domain-containing protein n=1 Tax=Streptomyces sp. 769 TaxID=1262452 RepID=UPI00057EB8DB|nr:DUF317 domain-containing protein [Streptomyces sp. 769]AJC55075.1 hypothetical protein GZL_02484 [Streptomyces sp. 769]